MGQIAGFLGHFGSYLDSESNLRSQEANKIIDEYNANVSNIPESEQMNYQKIMRNKAIAILRGK